MSAESNTPSVLRRLRQRMCRHWWKTDWWTCGRYGLYIHRCPKCGKRRDEIRV